MADHERWRSWTTFTELGGRLVSEDEVVEALKGLPLDAGRPVDATLENVAKDLMRRTGVRFWPTEARKMQPSLPPTQTLPHPRRHPRRFPV